MGIRKSIRRLLKKKRPNLSVDINTLSSKFLWLFDHPPSGGCEPAVSGLNDANDLSLVSRVMAAYKFANTKFEPSDSFWDKAILKLNSDIDEALMGSDQSQAAGKLRDPQNNCHFWGFDSIAQAPKGKTEPHQLLLERLDPVGNWQELYTLWTQDKLICLANVLGTTKLFYPEGARDYQGQTTDILLDEINEVLPFELEFPNPYAGELGLQSSRGIVSFRALQALYQAWRINEIRGDREEFRVLEIGAGLGRTAYFAHQFGITDYSIIDIPMTGAAQAYFLGRTLGEDCINLYGENSKGSVNLLPASALHELDQNYDLIVNIDSFTEMAEESMIGYWNFILEATPEFLSINHDENSRSVSDLFANDSRLRVKRHPYWMRRGYVEEHVTITSF